MPNNKPTENRQHQSPQPKQHKTHTPPNKNNVVDLYPSDFHEKLEFNKVLELLWAKCLSPLGQQHVERLRVQTDAEQIEKQLRQTHEFKQLSLYDEQPFPTDHFIDIRAELKLLALEGSVLGEEQFFKLHKTLRTVGDIARYFAGDTNQRRELYPETCRLADQLQVSRTLVNYIKSVMDDNGKVRSDASPDLLRIRKVIQECYKQLERQFNTLLAQYRKNEWLSDSEESVRNGRRVLAVPAEHKRKIRGMVHDVSNTGNTIFIEPEETLQLNNDLVEWQQAERQEIYKILRDLTAKIRPFTPDLQQYQKILGILDFVRAKALLAIDMNAYMPHISTEKNVELFGARHPLLYLKNQTIGKNTVPLNMSLNLAERILLVSGPNAGGKSVMLKTVGLLQVMFQCGMLVSAADHSTFCIFRNIFVDIGDEQSIENDLSTYSSRLKNMRYFTDFANAKTLLLIDEFGSGTDPMVGGAIAEAVLETLVQKFCYGVITTHYANLKIFASHTKGMQNGCMLFDANNLAPLYRLEIGKPGSSFAFELAVKSGLSPQLIATAKDKVDKDYKEFDELLTTLQREKQAVNERERVVLAKEVEYGQLVEQFRVKNAELDRKRKQILLETKEKALDSVQETNKKFDTMLREWGESKNVADKKEITKQIKTEITSDKQELKKEIELLKDGIYYRDSQNPVKPDCYVRVHNGLEVGKVVELRKDSAVVEFDLLRSTIKIRDLIVVEAIPKKERSNVLLNTSLEARSRFETTLDIRGMRRDEALNEVENFIDQALMFNVGDIKIIHGIGDGILRRSVRDLLRKIRAVSAVSDEEQQYGGTGVSLVSLA